MKQLFVLLQRILPQHLLSRLVGSIAKSRSAWLARPLMKVFIKIFGVDVSEAASANLEDYASFNEFFVRHLKPDARQIEGLVSSPADGTVSMLGRLDKDRMLQAKGLDYSLQKLLAGPGTSVLESGSFITIYLSPSDYHRVHTAVAGNLVRARYVPGKLFSVNQATTSQVKNLFADNERLVMRFATDFGQHALVMVGAMIVAGIKAAWREAVYPPQLRDEEIFEPARAFNQGEEVGYFEMGSTVILLFEGNVEWCVAPGDKVRMGQAIATRVDVDGNLEGRAD